MALLYIRNSADDDWILINSSEGNKIYDADGDTKIQVEESADEDIIRMDVAGSEALNISAAGEVTKILQPSFNVKLTSADTNLTADDNFQTILFNSEQFDIGSNFDTGTYTFTAPVDGKYILTVNLYIGDLDTDHNYFQARLNCSNSDLFATLDPGVLASNPVYWHLVMSGVMDMDANDTAVVDIRISGGASTTDIFDNSYFTGMLIG